MKRTCMKCGHEYGVRTFAFDSGRCPQCGEDFLERPMWFEGTEAATQTVWEFTAGIHVVILLFFMFLQDGGVLSWPMSTYSLTVLLYLGVRTVVARRRGFPVLSKPQVWAMLLLPLWGGPLTVFLLHAANQLRWET